MIGVILLVTVQLVLARDQNCAFQIPSTTSTGDCNFYSLKKQGELGIFEVNGTDYHKEQVIYYFTLCQSIPKDKLPKECVNLPDGPAFMYKIKTQGCYLLGNIASNIALPVDPMNSTKGIRLAYINGSNSSGVEYPFGVLYDFYCDVNANNKPLSAFEFPENTVKVHWPSQFACSINTSAGTCPRYMYDGTWNTVRLRPRPSWFDEAKFGIFIHWGVFSVPSFTSEWYWHRLMTGTPEVVEFHNRVYGCSGVNPTKFPCNSAEFSYYDFPPMFKAELFSPSHWASVFQKAGARYVVLITKHHEGWCNFPSKQHWNWNSVDLGPHMDLLGNLSLSVRKAGLIMGAYHSLREWYEPLYLKDEFDNCTTTDFPDLILNPTQMDLIEQYSPWVLWNDGAGDAACQHKSSYWKAPQFRSWVLNSSPVRDTIIINDRCGAGCIGDYTTGGDRFTPGHKLPYKWESCYTIQEGSWGYDRNPSDPYHPLDFLIYQLVETVACNGNLLLNVGPTADGRLDPIFEERLMGIGTWMDINGEAIYASVPWKVQNDTSSKQTWYTASQDGQSVYAITFEGITPGQVFTLTQPQATKSTMVQFLGYEGFLKYSQTSEGLAILVPTDLDRNKFSGQPAWTFKLSNVL